MAKLEEIALEMGFSKENFKKKVEKKYDYYSRKENATEKINYLLSLTEIKPTKETLKKYTLDTITRYLGEIEKKKANKLKVKLSEDEVHEAYKKYFEKDEFPQVEKLYDEYNILPRFEEFDMKKIYNKSFEWGGNLIWVKFLQRISGIKPELDEKLVQKHMWRWIDDRYEDMAEELIEVLGEVPKINEGRIQKWFYENLTKEHYQDVRKFSKLLNKKPSVRVIHRVYRDLLDEENIRGMHYLSRISDIPPLERDVQKIYRENMTGKNLDIGYINRVEEVTKIKPNIPEDLIQNAYKNSIGRYFWMNIKEIIEKFNILPKQKYVQKGYEIMMENEDFDDIREMVNLTKIKPSDEVYKTLVEKIMYS